MENVDVVMTIFWLIYLSCLLLAAVAAGYLLKRWFGLPSLLISAALIILPLSVPFSVYVEATGGYSFAPAWIVAAFEHLQGKPELSQAAIRAILLVQCAALLLLLLGVFIRRRLYSRA